MYKLICVLSTVLTLAGCSNKTATPSRSAEPSASLHQQTQEQPSHAVHVHPEPVKTPSLVPYVIELKPLRPLTQNSPSNIELKIVNRSGQTVKHKQFKVVHGERIHTLLIDPSLKDYQHIHMRPDDFNGPALYEFTLTPREAGDYKLYLDVVDQKNKQYFLETSFYVPGDSAMPSFNPGIAQGNLQTLSQAHGLSVYAETASPIRAKQPVTLQFTVKKDDELFRKLEPTMQAYAHLIGFNGDRTQIMHAHPMGEEPRSSNQRGGPNLNFEVQFPTSGYYRMFLQVRVGGKDIFIPFDVRVRS